jgi:hypothetical protein
MSHLRIRRKLQTYRPEQHRHNTTLLPRTLLIGQVWFSYLNGPTVQSPRLRTIRQLDPKRKTRNVRTYTRNTHI